jgi:hypothetical protein
LRLIRRAGAGLVDGTGQRCPDARPIRPADAGLIGRTGLIGCAGLRCPAGLIGCAQLRCPSRLCCAGLRRPSRLIRSLSMQRVGSMQNKTYAQARYRQRGRFEESSAGHCSPLPADIPQRERSCHPAPELSTGLTRLGSRCRPAVGRSAVIPLLAAMFPLQIPQQFRCSRYGELALNRLKSRTILQSVRRFSGRCRQISPATAESASSRSSVQERG